MLDLFGNDRPQPRSRKTSAHQLDLLDVAAERAALASGRPKSQERAELVAPQWEAPTCGKCGGLLLLEAGGARRFSCPRCA